MTSLDPSRRRKSLNHRPGCTEKAQKESMVKQYKENRSSNSSDNMDEELANMMQYQKAYEASARFINTVDKMMETVINM